MTSPPDTSGSQPVAGGDAAGGQDTLGQDTGAQLVGPARETLQPETAADGRAGADDAAADTAATSSQLVDLVEQPAKVLRIGSMVKQLLEEVKAAPLDEASRRRLREIHGSSVRELKQGLAPELVAELDRLSLPFGPDDVPSEAELRVAQAQLVGWLEGLFHGIQTALFAQQMAARAQLEQMRRALPAGPGVPTDGRGSLDAGHDSGGLYL